MGQTRRQAEVPGAEAAPPDPSRPFLELARELQAEARRWADDPDAAVESLVEVFDRLPREARLRTAEATFQNLPVEQRWAVLERLFGDDDLRSALEAERAVARAAAAAAVRRAALSTDVATHHVLDTRLIPLGEQLIVGLFREPDVRAALAKGRASTTCARRVVFRTTGDDGSLQVVEDVFNPSHGLFMTPDYDDRVWRDERFEPHTTVRIGAATATGLEPIVVPGGRLDVETAGVVRLGRLHVAWAALADVDLFPSTTHPASLGGNQP